MNIQGRREWRINSYLDVLCERLPHVLDNEVDSLPYCGVVFEVNDNERLSLFFSKLSGQGDLLARVERSQQRDHHRHESQHGCCDGCGGRPVVRLPGTEVDCQHSRGACHGVRLGHRHARVSRTDRSCSFSIRWRGGSKRSEHAFRHPPLSLGVSAREFVGVRGTDIRPRPSLRSDRRHSLIGAVYASITGL